MAGEYGGKTNDVAMLRKCHPENSNPFSRSGFVSCAEAFSPVLSPVGSVSRRVVHRSEAVGLHAAAFVDRMGARASCAGPPGVS
jgi:hypothetical protein